MPELADALGVDQLLAHAQPMRGLIADGTVAKFGASSATQYAVSGVWALTLYDLGTRAAICENPDLKLQAGRRSKVGEHRAIEEVNPRQMRQISATLGKIALLLGGKGADRDPESRAAALRQIGVEHFAWDENGGDGGEGDWTRFIELAERASLHKDPGGKSADDDKGAARLLLDLSATHGWIAKTGKHAEGFERIPGEWASLYDQWRELLRKEWAKGKKTRAGKRAPGNTKQALMELMGACSALGMHPQSAEWKTVLRHLEARWEANDTPSHVQTWARRAYRDLRAKKCIQGPALPNGGTHRKSLVPNKLVKRVARAYGADRNGHEKDTMWVEPEESVWNDWLPLARGLAEGEFGLRQFLVYQCVFSGRQAEAYGVPERAVWPNSPVRDTNTKRAERAWRAGSIQIHLKRLMQYAGWLQRERGVDFSKPENDLRVLLDEEHLKEYSKSVNRGKVSTLWQFYWVVSVLARIASPYLEAVAKGLGEEELMHRMNRVGRMLDSSDGVDGKKSWKKDIGAQLPSQDEIVKAQARRTRKALTQEGKLGEHGYEVLVKIRDALVDRMGIEAGGLTLDQQIEAIQRGVRFSREWARRCEEAQYVQDQLIAPLRSKTLRGMRSDMRKWTGLQPWEGRHYAEYPHWLMKGGRQFHPEYLRADDNHPESEAWTLWDPRVFGLYRMDGGAREILLTRADGTLWPSDRFYVPDVQTPQGHLDENNAVLSGSMLAYIRRRFFEATRHVTGLPGWRELQKAGGTANHCFRHAFGSYWAPKNLHFAKTMLHHADVRTTERWYCDEDESNAGGAGTAARGFGR